MDGRTDGWMDGWMDGWIVGSLRACGPHVAQVSARARRQESLARAMQGLQAMRETAGGSERAGDAGNVAGLLHSCSVLSLPPTRAPMAARAVMMHKRRSACRWCEGSAATVSRKAKPQCCQTQMAEVENDSI